MYSFCRRRFSACVGLATLLLLAAPTHAADPGPQNVVREFCQLDANGARLGSVSRELSPLVGWIFEPAWDVVLFITGYQIGSTRPLEEGRLAVDVEYAVVGEATALGFEAVAYRDRVTFVLDTPDEISWRIQSPMVPPHVFAARMAADDVVAALKNGRGGFVSNSLFVQRLMRTAGWDVGYERTADLLSHGTYGTVDVSRAGDLVVYTQDGAAYHVGILERDGKVVSATLNGGIVRTTLNAFLGEVQYLRLRATGRIPTVAPSTPTPE
jgi:hypothetical protein